MIVDKKSEDIMDNIDMNQKVLYRKLDHFEMERGLVLESLDIFLRWNQQTQYLSEDKLQKLWMKLVRKYKFSR